MDAGRTFEAKALFDPYRQLYKQIQNPISQLRISWLEANIALDLGRIQEAEDLLRGIRDGFVERGNVFEAALVTLDLSLLCADREAGWPRRSASPGRCSPCSRLTVFRARRSPV